MLKKLSLVIISILILTGNFYSKDKYATKEILPLKEGNWWRFSAIEFADTGKIVQDSAVIAIGSKKKYGNQLWYKIELKSRELGTNEMISFHLFKYPTIADEKNIMNIDGQEAIIYTRQTDLKVEVPAGIFTCIEYYAEIEGGIHFYACPGVGLIKMEGVEQIMGTGNDRKPGKKFALELMEYNVK